MARHPSAAHQKLRVLVGADAELSSARIFVEGCVTAVNIDGLDRVRRRPVARDGDHSRFHESGGQGRKALTSGAGVWNGWGWLLPRAAR